MKVSIWRARIALLLPAFLVACGGGGSTPAPTYSVSGTVSGLIAGRQLVLTNNGGDNLTVAADGSVLFATKVTASGSYAVAVFTQPAGQDCVVTNGSGVNIQSNISSISVTCTALKYAYVADGGNNAIAQFKIDATGKLVPLPVAEVATGVDPYGVSIDKTNHYAYVANAGDDSISQFLIGLDGALTPMAVPKVKTCGVPLRVALEPLGQMAYVACSRTSVIQSFAIDATGALSTQAVSEVPTGPNPTIVSIHPTQPWVYVPNPTDGTVSQYGIGSGGALYPLVPSNLSVGIVFALAIDPLGRYAYAPDLATDTLIQLDIDSGGRLTKTVGASPAPTGAGGFFPVVSPNGRFAFVSNNIGGSVSAYAVGVGGLPTSYLPATATAGSAPAGMAIDSSGQYLYVSNNNDRTLSQYTIDTLGVLKPNGVVLLPTGASAGLVATWH